MRGITIRLALEIGSFVFALEVENIDHKAKFSQKVGVAGCNEMFSQFAIIVVEYVGWKRSWVFRGKCDFKEIL